MAPVLLVTFRNSTSTDVEWCIHYWNDCSLSLFKNNNPWILNIYTGVITFICINYMPRFEDGPFFLRWNVQNCFRAVNTCNYYFIVVWSLKPKDIDNIHISKKKVPGFFSGFKNTTNSNTKWWGTVFWHYQICSNHTAFFGFLANFTLLIKSLHI